MQASCIEVDEATSGGGHLREIEKMIEQQNGYFEGKDRKRGVPLDGATTLSTPRAENEQLRAELEQVKRCIEIVENQRDQMKRERDAAVEDLHKLCPAWKWDGEEG